MTVTRRRFVAGSSLALSSLGILRVPFFEEALEGAEAGAGQGRSLLVIQLGGGNDGLNTVVPYTDPSYPALRPTIGLGEGERLDLNGRVALHAALAPLRERFTRGQLAVVQSVGYPKPDRSHFTSTAIWQTARLEPYRDSTGWLGRAIDATQPGAGGRAPLTALGIGGGGLSPALQAQATSVPSLLSLDAFSMQPDRRYPSDAPALRRAVEDMYSGSDSRSEEGFIRQVGNTALRSSEVLRSALAGYSSTVTYPQGTFGGQLKLVAQLLTSGTGTRVFHVTLSGFDTHANQKTQQRALFDQLGQGIDAFLLDLERHGCGSSTAVLTYSEFGRRAGENGSAGTDHGSGSVAFVAGEGVAGGLYGPMADLGNLSNGDVPFAVDFRSVYASVLRDWLGVPPDRILGPGFGELKLFRS
jgi:uncharacterized protein (DUF1501 family)